MVTYATKFFSWLSFPDKFHFSQYQILSESSIFYSSCPGIKWTFVVLIDVWVDYFMMFIITRKNKLLFILVLQLRSWWQYYISSFYPHWIHDSLLLASCLNYILSFIQFVVLFSKLFLRFSLTLTHFLN